MKVILLKEVKTLGLEGDVVNVSDGYARNFLFPQNLAVQASADAVKATEEKKRRTSAKEKKELTSTRRLASKLDGLELTINAKANDEGTLFAAVSGKDVQKELKAHKVKIKPEQVEFAKPIKETGAYVVTVNLPHGLEAELNVTIEKS